VPFNVWSVDADHLLGELDCRPLFRPLTPEVAGSSPFFARPFGSEMGARENGLSGGFSFPPDDDEEFRRGRGKRVNRPPATTCDPPFLGFSDYFAQISAESSPAPSSSELRFRRISPPLSVPA
jgi:hypothetical protein